MDGRMKQSKPKAAYGLACFLLTTPVLMLAATPSLSKLIVGFLSGILMLVSNPTVSLLSLSVLTLIIALRLTGRARVYLVDFACYKPDDDLKRSREFLIKSAIRAGGFNDQSVTFMKKMLERSGIGQDTYQPSAITKVPEKPTMEDAMGETREIMFGAIEELLAKTKVDAKDVGILVVNSSLFCPVPSLSATVVNRFKLREDITSHSLGGMGCSAGLIAIDLAKQLLQVHPNTYALVVSTENITLNCYYGNYRPMLVTNSLFRIGGAAVLLSNRSFNVTLPKYKLSNTVRTNIGPNDRAYGSVLQEEDEEGNVGIALSKDLMEVAGEALKTNITTLGPLVLPLSEKLLFVWSLIKRRLLKLNIKPYVPDFKQAFEHFCIHAGGRAVLDAMEKNLCLLEWHMEPSRMTLWRWGNTSSSSLWYELAYMEAKGRIKKGDRLWQIAFGSGFKCNSAVWKALRDINPAKEKNPWMEDIDKFPVEVPRVAVIDA